MIPPWQPMSEAPKDGSNIVVAYSDLSGTVVVYWGEFEYEPGEAWFMFVGDVGNYEETDEFTDTGYGWVPYPK